MSADGCITVGNHSIRKTLLIIILIGIAVRLILTPLTSYDYDDYYWAQIVRNINSGNALYEIEGYYYTPIWGYILGFFDIIWSYLSPTGELGLRVMELFRIEEMDYFFHSATVVNPLFISGLKMLLIISDILVGYLLYKLIKGSTDDIKKAEMGFALWFLCPIVIYMSSVQCMFDSVLALMTLLSFMLLKEDKNVLSGAMIGLAALLKIFPAICIPIFLSYIIMKNRSETKTAASKSMMFIAGCAVIIIVTLLPDFINNDISSVLALISNRVISNGQISLRFLLAIIGAVIFSILVFCIMQKIKTEMIDEALTVITLVSLIAMVILTLGPAPQYCIVFIPFLILCIIRYGKWYMISWVIISTATTFKAIVMNNSGLLAMASKYYGFPDYNWVITTMQALCSPLFDKTILYYLNRIGDYVYSAGMVLVILIAILPLFRNWMSRRKKNKIDGISDRGSKEGWNEE